MSRLKSAQERHAKWERRYDPEHIAKTMTAEKPIMSMHAREKFEQLYELELGVKQVLNSLGVSVASVANYLCFGRQVWKADQTYDGELFELAAATYVNKWASRGLDIPVLDAIMKQVFHTELPI